MRKIIITGANCFIGRHLCRYLADSSTTIFAVMRPHSSLSKDICALPGVVPIWCNEMSEYGNLTRLVSEKCDIGIMLAWNGTRGKTRDDSALQDNNLENSKLCAKEMIALGCKTIMLAGSQAEYGTTTADRKTREDDVPNPNTEYGKKKLELYQWLKAYSQDKKVRVLEPRFFSLYGEDDYEQTLLISLVRKLLLKQTCELTKCVQIWDYMYIEDAVAALGSLLDNLNAEGVYNFGSGIARPLKEYVEIIREMIDQDSNVVYGAIDYPITGMVNTNPDVTRLKQATGRVCEYDFIRGITKVIETQREVLGV